MQATAVLIHVVGEIALLMWGIHMVNSGVLRAFGSDLRWALGAGLRTRARAFLAGLGVTAALQSSTATAMMVSSFAAGGAVGLVPALAVMLGANVGTTLIVQLLSFDVSLLYPALLFLGLVGYRRGGSSRVRDVGRVMVGLGLMLLSLHLLSETIAPIASSAALRGVLQALGPDPVIPFLIAAALAWASHSSVAAVLLTLSLASAGVVEPRAAAAMVLGANLGSALNPLIDGMGSDPTKLRLPLGNLLTRVAGCALALPLLDPALRLLSALDPDPARLLANLHTGFNLAVALAFVGLLPLVARLLARLLPERVRASDPGVPQYLDPNALETPSVALTNAAREVLRMADVVETMLRGSQDLFHADDPARVAEVSRMDDVVDRLYSAVQRYLGSIGRESLTEEEVRRLSEIMAFAINLEHVGDILDKNLMELAAKRIRHRLKLPEEAAAEIDRMHARLLDHLQLAASVLMFQDIAAARRLVEEKEAFREVERAAARRHLEEMRNGPAHGAEASALQLDIVRDLKRIEAHVAATAYGLLERRGDLRPSRLTQEAG